ncbi:MAG: lytic transglycosylase domain-containing protein [Vicinamibacterales bacterium]
MKLVAAAALVAIGIVSVSAQQPGGATPEVPAAPVRPSFAEFLDGIRAEARARGVSDAVIESALSGIEEPMPVVLERDRTQAETVLTLETYISRQLTVRRIRTGREMVARYRAALDAVAAKYGVPARIIAGIWGMESNFGRFSGVRPTVAALATLAWDPRRSTYFRGELFSALEILNRGDIAVDQLKGSWAGAMGQPQFMPSSYLKFAEDFDGDGRRDIWTTPVDVFASIANYLKGHGWVDGQLWGREVKVSREAASRIAGTVARRDASCRAKRDMTVALPLAEWQRLGVRTLAGRALPKVDIEGALVSGSSRHFLVYGNYDALLDYNCAHPYALSVALLGDRLAAAAAPRASAPARPAASKRSISAPKGRKAAPRRSGPATRGTRRAGRA